MEILISNLDKKYGKIKAIDSVSCTMHKGIYEVLGRNGAGKTTLFRMITSLIKETSGEILFKDNGNYLEKKEIDWLIGYLPQDFGMYPDFTVYEIMEEISILRNTIKSNRKDEINSLLEKVNLLECKNKKYKELSGGMKRRLGLSQAMLGTPKILIVDEPTAGVDPKERIYIRKLLSEYAKENIVILSTHLVEDIEHICEELLIIEQGKLIYQGKIDNLLLQASKNLGIREFCTLYEFQEYSCNNNVFTFRRECKIIIATGPKSKVDIKEFNVSLEDEYMWKISEGENLWLNFLFLT